MSYIGSSEIKEMYLGSTEIARAYLGSTLVFKKVAPVFYDRLVFDGTAYIDTDIIPTNGYSFNVKLGNESQKVAQSLFQLACNNGTYMGSLYIVSGTSTTQRRITFYYASSNQQNQYISWSIAEYNYFLTPTRGGWDSTSYTLSRGSYACSGGLILGSRVGHTGQNYTGTMSDFCIYGTDAQSATTASDFANYTPIYTLRPCIYDGEVGMWCVETRKFYGNSADSGTLSVYNL